MNPAGALRQRLEYIFLEIRSVLMNKNGILRQAPDRFIEASGRRDSFVGWISFDKCDRGMSNITAGPMSSIPYRRTAEGICPCL